MLQNNVGEYYCLSLSLSSPEVGPSPLPGELKVYMPWYALKDGDDGGTWGIGGMTTCEVGMGIIMPLLRMTMLLNKSSSLSSRSSSLLPCSASLSALLSSSCISVAFISSCCFANLSIMVEMSFWALSDFVILRLFRRDGPGWSSSVVCWHS